MTSFLPKPNFMCRKRIQANKEHDEAIVKLKFPNLRSMLWDSTPISDELILESEIHFPKIRLSQQVIDDLQTCLRTVYTDYDCIVITLRKAGKTILIASGEDFKLLKLQDCQKLWNQQEEPKEHLYFYKSIVLMQESMVMSKDQTPQNLKLRFMARMNAEAQLEICVCHLKYNLFMTQIPQVFFAVTPLSNKLLGKVGNTGEGFGLLTVNENRKVVFLLETDAMVREKSTPIVGSWMVMNSQMPKIEEIAQTKRIIHFCNKCRDRKDIEYLSKSNVLLIMIYSTPTAVKKCCLTLDLTKEINLKQVKANCEISNCFNDYSFNAKTTMIDKKEMSYYKEVTLTKNGTETLPSVRASNSSNCLNKAKKSISNSKSNMENARNSLMLNQLHKSVLQLTLEVKRLQTRRNLVKNQSTAMTIVENDEVDKHAKKQLRDFSQVVVDLTDEKIQSHDEAATVLYVQGLCNDTDTDNDADTDKDMHAVTDTDNATNRESKDNFSVDATIHSENQKKEEVMVFNDPSVVLTKDVCEEKNVTTFEKSFSIPRILVRAESIESEDSADSDLLNIEKKYIKNLK